MHRRRTWGLVLTLAFGVLLAGCTPPDEPGVGMGADGLPVVENCGTWITAVTVKDDTTGTTLWSARAEGETRDLRGVGAVKIGEVPRATWTETVPLTSEPRPDRWRFEIGGYGEVTTIVVPSSSFEPDRVFRPNGKSASRNDYVDRTCNGKLFPDISSTLLGRVLVADLAVLAVFLVWWNRRSRRQDPVAAGKRM